MTTPFDVIALGETMVSLIAVDGTLDGATRFHATHGGAETNTLVAMSRSGANTAWVGRVGDDVLGRRIEGVLGREGIDLRWLRRDEARPTGVMIRDTSGSVVYRRSGSAASALSPDDLRDVPLREARAVLVTGITALLGEAAQRAAVAMLETAGGLRVVDPNLRPGLWGSDRAIELITPLLQRCDLLLGGETELAALVGAGRPGDLRSLAERCKAAGPREVVIKRGADGAVVLDTDDRWAECSGPSVRQIDPVGAGDAFNAGYLGARLAGASAADALAAGADLGAAVATSFGDTTEPAAGTPGLENPEPQR